jgi:hypothetical protein
MRDVLKNLIDGLNEAWIKIVNIGGFHVNLRSLTPTKIRSRCDETVVSFISATMATVETVGAFVHELRVVVIDGTCLDLPDSDENARVLVVREVVQVQEQRFRKLD